MVTCEERSFYWRLTGRQNLQFYGALYNLKTSEIRNRIRQLSHLLELEDILEQRFDSYSTGTKQKMAIARALIHDPEIIFMDEPTRSLDPLIAAEVRSFIKKELVEQQGKTIVLATHQLQEAEQLCDRIAVMNRGQFIAVGSLEELHTAFEKTRVCVLKTKQPIGQLTPLLYHVMGSKEIFIRQITPTFIEIEFPNEAIIQGKLTDLIMNTGVEVEECKILEPSLEKIFVHLAENRMGQLYDKL